MKTIEIIKIVKKTKNAKKGLTKDEIQKIYDNWIEILKENETKRAKEEKNLETLFNLLLPLIKGGLSFESGDSIWYKCNKIFLCLKKQLKKKQVFFL
jgi:hypothetical protein